MQLLEAASVLVTMNNRPVDGDSDANAAVTPPDSARDSSSEHGSDSPAYQNYDRSSVDTTPPPAQMDVVMDGAKRESSAAYPSPPPFGQERAAAFSRSYQSVLPGREADAGFGFGHRRQVSRDNLRPLSSGKNMTGQEDNELAAAVELLSCSFNSTAGDANTVAPGSVRGLSGDVPPVPPVPAQYLGQSATPLGDTSFISSFPSRAPESFTRGERGRLSAVDYIKTEGSSDSPMDEDEEDRMSRSRSDDDDDGVFGRMEE